MNHRFSLVVSGGLLWLSIAGCSQRTPPTPAPANLITQNDFEAMQGWTPDGPSLTTAQARSGRFSLQVGPTAEYSTGYSALLQTIKQKPGDKIRVSGWGLRSSFTCRAVVVVQVNDPDKTPATLLWQTIDLSARIKTLNHWTSFTEDFELPANAGPQARLNVYLWRTNPIDTMYLDDLVISHI